MPYAVPSSPLRSVPARHKRLSFLAAAAPGFARSQQAQARAVAMRRGFARLGYMGIRFASARGDRAALLSGMGCKECRTGLSWLSDLPSGISPDVLPAILTDQPPTVIASPFPTITPTSAPIPSAVAPVPVAIPNIPLNATNAIQAASAAYNNLAVLTGAAPPFQLAKPPAVTAGFLDRQTIPGVSNKVLLGAGLAVVALGAVFAGKRR